MKCRRHEHTANPAVAGIATASPSATDRLDESHREVTDVAGDRSGLNCVRAISERHLAGGEAALRSCTAQCSRAKGGLVRRSGLVLRSPAIVSLLLLASGLALWRLLVVEHGRSRTQYFS